MTPIADPTTASPWLLTPPVDEPPTWRQWLAERGTDLGVAIGLVSAIVMTNLFVDVLHVNMQRGQQLRADQLAAATVPASRAPAPSRAPAAGDSLVLAAGPGTALPR